MERIFLVSYALILLIGGFIGFKKGGSIVSLIMGTVSCVAILLAVKILSDNPKTAYLLLSVLSVSLTFVFVLRFMKTHALMPAGMLLVLNLIVAMICILKFLKM